jgi:hypothetical protein
VDLPQWTGVSVMGRPFFSNKDPSVSHAMALNYLYDNYVSVSHAQYFGILDHDIFPIAPVQISDKLQNQPFLGQAGLGVGTQAQRTVPLAWF